MEKIKYKIEGYNPSGHMSMGGYGFNVLLDMDSALELLKIPHNPAERVSSIAKTILKDLFGNRLFHPPYRFMKMRDGSKRESCLIHWCTVQGDACNLGIAFGDISSETKHKSEEKWVIYSSHNVDSPQQAYGLLSLWLLWFNMMDGLKTKTGGLLPSKKEENLINANKDSGKKPEPSSLRDESLLTQRSVS